MEEYTDYFDDLIDTCVARDCLEEAFGIDSKTSKEAMVAWAKILIERHSD